MKFNINNSWLGGGIIGGIFLAILAGYMFKHEKGEKAGAVYKARIEDADALLEQNMPMDALKEYNELLKEVSVNNDPETYARIKINEGVCYYKLANVSNKAENLKKAIRAYEDALKVYTVEEYPFDYATTQSNLGIACCILAGVGDKEKNFKKAIRAFEEALKICTVEEYPSYHGTIMSNMEKAKQMIRQ